MAALILLTAYLRSRFVILEQNTSTSNDQLDEDARQQLLKCPHAVRTVGHENKRMIGPAFVSAGRVVVLVALVGAATEITLAVLIFHL